jgi:hypothetical protein
MSKEGKFSAFAKKSKVFEIFLSKIEIFPAKGKHDRFCKKNGCAS